MAKNAGIVAIDPALSSPGPPSGNKENRALKTRGAPIISRLDSATFGTRFQGTRKMDMSMHVQVATYRMADVSEPDFIEANKEFAEAMAAVPGLLAKVWLKGAEGNVFGGLYLWEDRAACESFLASELWAEALKDDSMLELVSHDFAVMEELTRTTQPGMVVVP